MTLKNDIDRIMTDSRRLFDKNMVVRYSLEKRDDAEMKVLVVAPKRRFKLAVSRNRIKRQLREIIRTNKPTIINQLPDDKALHLALIYTGPEQLNFEETNKTIQKILARINR